MRREMESLKNHCVLWQKWHREVPGDGLGGVKTVPRAEKMKHNYMEKKRALRESSGSPPGGSRRRPGRPWGRPGRACRKKRRRFRNGRSISGNLGGPGKGRVRVNPNLY